MQLPIRLLTVIRESSLGATPPKILNAPIKTSERIPSATRAAIKTKTIINIICKPSIFQAYIRSKARARMILFYKAKKLVTINSLNPRVLLRKLCHLDSFKREH